MVRGLNTVFDLQSNGLSERCGTEWQMSVGVQEKSRISSLTGAVVHANPADDARRYRRFSAHAESCVSRASRAERSDAGQKGQPIEQVVGHHTGDQAAIPIAYECVTADRCQTGSVERLHENTFRPRLEFEARSVGEGNRQFPG